MMKTYVVQDPAEIDALSGAWQAACPSKRPTLIVARDGDEVVGVLPIAKSPRKLTNLHFSIVTPFAYGDYIRFLVKSGRTAEMLPSMLDQMVGHNVAQKDESGGDS